MRPGLWSSRTIPSPTSPEAGSLHDSISGRIFVTDHTDWIEPPVPGTGDLFAAPLASTFNPRHPTSHVMDLRRCYAILNVPEGADLEVIKKAYRKQAFKCHPDLNPDDPEAAGKFQRLNEAYVVLISSASTPGHSRKKTRADRARARQASSKSTTGDTFSSRSNRSETTQEARSTSGQAGFRNEEILKNILNDPFARQVFEDIFRRVKKSKPEETGAGGSSKRFSLGGGPRTLDLSRVGIKGLKAWLRSQLDYEQTLYLDPIRLKPGTSIRFEISRRFQDTPTMLTTTIPQDYVAGRPLRLKGQGRKLGPWTGDLYLRLLTK